MCIEDGDYASPQRPSRKIEGWSVAQIKKVGAAAVKVYCHYHPDDRKLAQAQEGFVAELVQECRRFDLPLFAEPISYGVTGEERRRVVIESGRRFSRLGVDVLKAEFPLDIQTQQDEKVWEAACRELSEAIAIPWVLLSAGVDFDTFTRQVRAACKGGASGYLAGRAIWKDAMMLDEERQEAFLCDTAVGRLEALTSIVNELGRPWTEVYAAQAVEKAWYKTL
jgi:tagatose-1,6-bisphosphate aldolase